MSMFGSFLMSIIPRLYFLLDLLFSANPLLHRSEWLRCKIRGWGTVYSGSARISGRVPYLAL